MLAQAGTGLWTLTVRAGSFLNTFRPSLAWNFTAIKTVLIKNGKNAGVERDLDPILAQLNANATLYRRSPNPFHCGSALNLLFVSVGD